MSPREMLSFRVSLGMDEKEFAEFIGVTWQAVRLWETGQRAISETTARIVRLFKKYPELVKEY
ncbi:MAG: helix-turn-helix domain-containing protein [Bdellovibrio sp.]